MYKTLYILDVVLLSLAHLSGLEFLYVFFIHCWYRFYDVLLVWCMHVLGFCSAESKSRSLKLAFKVVLFIVSLFLLVFFNHLNTGSLRPTEKLSMIS